MYQERKHFVGKAFKSIVLVESVVAETNDFFQAFSLLLATFNIFNVE